MKPKGRLTGESGAVAVIVALVLVALMAFLALVIDVGQLFLVRSRLQSAADSAALAGAQALAQQQPADSAGQTAEEYADRNLTVSHRTTISFPADRLIEVDLATDQPTFFGRVLGWTGVTVRAGAQAGYAAVSSVNDIVPIIVPYQEIDAHIGPENTASFSLAGQNTDDAQRGFFWLANFSGTGAGTPEYSEWIINGYPDPVAAGMIGNGDGMKAALDAAVEQRMSTDPSIILPLFDYTEATGGSKAYHVVGFAEFVITGFGFQGNPKTITGYFTTGTVVEGETGEAPPVDYGVYAVRLKG